MKPLRVWKGGWRWRWACRKCPLYSWSFKGGAYATLEAAANAARRHLQEKHAD